MAATSAEPRAYESGIDPVFNDFDLETSAVMYEGSVATADPAANTVGAFAAGDVFVGFVASDAKQADGATRVKVRQRGIVKLTVTGTNAETDIGDSVYATDNNTFNHDSTSALLVGKVHRVISQGATTAEVMVYFEAVSLRSL